jgi:xanthine phosphoribosyltransferase
MQELIERIRKEGRNLGGGILKVDSFLNHQIDPALMVRLGAELARRLEYTHPTKVLTAETSGIAPALATAAALNIPVVFARKHAPLTMDYTIVSENAKSRTHGNVVELMVSTEYLTPQDRVLIIDDFLATAQTIEALVRLVHKVNARVVGIGTVVEKKFEGGREHLGEIDVPIISLAIISNMDDGKIVFE